MASVGLWLNSAKLVSANIKPTNLGEKLLHLTYALRHFS